MLGLQSHFPKSYIVDSIKLITFHTDCNDWNNGSRPSTRLSHGPPHIIMENQELHNLHF